MVTTPLLTSVRLAKSKVTWTFHDASEPGDCKFAEWCDGDCDDYADSLGGSHGREIATAMVDGEPVLAVDVGQWKADPAKPWREGANLIYRNDDRAPYVFLHVFGEHNRGTSIAPPHALTIGYALRLAGDLEFATAMYDAYVLAQDIEDARHKEKDERKSQHPGGPDGRRSGYHPDHPECRS
jgi:hypothetical protein